jgi:hypothetical protein
VIARDCPTGLLRRKRYRHYTEREGRQQRIRSSNRAREYFPSTTIHSPPGVEIPAIWLAGPVLPRVKGRASLAHGLPQLPAQNRGHVLSVHAVPVVVDVDFLPGRPERGPGL